MNIENIVKQLNEIASKMCDEYCKYPYEVENEEELYKICEGCPMGELI